MNEADTDWLIYHLIVKGHGAFMEGLAVKSGLDRPTVEASVRRLEHYLLVQRNGEKTEALSVNESLIRCQIRHDTLTPFTIVDGVIKEKKRQEP